MSLRDSEEILEMKILNVYPIDDEFLEGDETVVVTLLPNSEYIIDMQNDSKTIIIQDNELPDIQFSQPSMCGEESITKPQIKLELSLIASEDITVNYMVTEMLAKKGEDYTIETNKIIIPAGSQEVTVPIIIKNDSKAEDDETVVITLVSAGEANIGHHEKHFYTIINDDGPLSANVVHDKIYGSVLGFRAGCSMGAAVEMVRDIDLIEEYHDGPLDKFLPYVHYRSQWSHPAGATEDGGERHKLMCTAIIEKQDRITAEDLVKIWIRDCEIEDMYYMTQSFDRTLLSYAKWGFPADQLLKSKFGMPKNLGEHIHLAARVFQAIPCVNVGDPDAVIEDVNEIGKLYYENQNDDAFAWGKVYNIAMALAMLPDATVNSVIEESLKYATQEMKTEIEAGLAIVDKYSDPMDRGLRDDLNMMYSDPASPYCVDSRIQKHKLSSIYENVTCAFAILKATMGNVKQAVIIAVNRGRDSDCTAASAGALAGALSGTKTIPKEWIIKLDEGIKNNPYTNSHLLNKATADGLYRAFQNRVKKMKEYVLKMEKQYDNKLPDDIRKKKQYVKLIEKVGGI
jgi:hypothetical protein